MLWSGGGQPQKLDAHLLGQDTDPQHWKFVLTLPEEASSDVLSRLRDKGARRERLQDVWLHCPL